MSDQDIQFGEVEEVSPERRRRPDRDRHFAVVDYGTPSHGDLPIFIDMDVLADMETHARTDTSVELGGVMLGGQYLDEDGHPFVLVSDSLRAEHYESTRGHFKFTHDTWTEISRQRDGFSEDLQMVGWYHTHPDWGVFLSGMDRFICDHFFNRPLDVAMVIDPVRNDRGWFCWRQEGDERLPRAGGFWVTASRFRQRQLAAYVAQLQGKTTMKPDFMLGGEPGIAPGVLTQVVHTIRPQMGWMGIAILAMLVLQACLTLLVALRLDGSGEARGFQRGTWQAASAEPEKELRRQFTLLEEKLQRLAKADFLLAELTENYKTLKHERDELAARVGELEETNAELLAGTDRLDERLREANESRDEALAQLKIAQAEIDRLKLPAAEADGEKPGQKGERPAEATEESASADEEPDGEISAWTMGLSVVMTLVLVAIIVVIVIKRKRDFKHPETEGAPESAEP
jgi:proteasome lid subunit RPN8/RPN11